MIAADYQYPTVKDGKQLAPISLLYLESREVETLLRTLSK